MRPSALVPAPAEPLGEAIRDDIHEAFLVLGCALIFWRRLKSLRQEF